MNENYCQSCGTVMGSNYSNICVNCFISGLNDLISRTQFRSVQTQVSRIDKEEFDKAEKL